MPERGSDAWFEELHEQLSAVAEKLVDAAQHAEHAALVRAEIDRQLAAVQDMLAAIDRHLERTPPDPLPEDS